MSNTAAVLTWGCSHNQKDSQLIEGQLLAGGYDLLQGDDIDSADIVILNSCTVKTPTENKILHVLDSLQQTGKQVVVTGCLSQAEPEFLAARYPDYTLLGVNAAEHILAVLKEQPSSLIPLQSLNERNIRDNQLNWSDKPLMASTQWNPNLNIVQINEGCLNSCTFCATKKARGHLRSYKREHVVHSIRSVISPEVWITSQDTACWGFDLGENLADLLRDIDQINRKFWLRVGMGNPNNLIKVLDEVIEAYKSPKIYKFLHLPVQAGNNDVLKHMRRGYTVEEYETIVEQFRKAYPEITLATDVICGYPTESREAFQETIDTILKTRPSITNISRYWERRGTPAAEMDQLSFSERKSRSTELAKLCKNMQLEDNRKWIGWEGEVYLAEEGSKGGIQARNLAYKPIIVDAELSELGTWRYVRITEAKSTYFIGELLT
ncbi:MAG: tRNA (N(6)-L-threonylcarbamoyladenosine(37)-C(2))-methylthiotransferase [Candidatus Kariarchaeaceae archaeon]|jgi:MiaB-like tRNA modifying enzyme